VSEHRSAIITLKHWRENS